MCLFYKINNKIIITKKWKYDINHNFEQMNLDDQEELFYNLY